MGQTTYYTINIKISKMKNIIRKHITLGLAGKGIGSDQVGTKEFFVSFVCFFWGGITPGSIQLLSTLNFVLKVYS